MGLSTSHLCFKMCLEEPFHATKPRSTYFSGAKNHRLHVVDTYQENRYTHLTYSPATQLRCGDVSKTTKYDVSSFTYRGSSFDPQFCLSWGIRFEAVFRRIFLLSKWRWARKASHQPLQVQNPSFVDYPERSIVKRAGVTLPTSPDSR